MQCTEWKYAHNNCTCFTSALVKGCKEFELKRENCWKEDGMQIMEGWSKFSFTFLYFFQDCVFCLQAARYLGGGFLLNPCLLWRKLVQMSVKLLRFELQKNSFAYSCFQSCVAAPRTVSRRRGCGESSATATASRCCWAVLTRRSWATVLSQPLPPLPYRCIPGSFALLWLW